MAAGIEIQVGKIRGPWLDIVVERVKKHYVMGVITAHNFPRLDVTPHTAKPEVFPGVWQLAPYAKKSASGVKLVGVQAELFPQDFKRVNGAVRRWRCKLMIDKSGVGFFEIELIAIVRNRDITGTKELMKFFDQNPVILEGLFVGSWEVREGPYGDLVIVRPTIGEA